MRLAIGLSGMLLAASAGPALADMVEDCLGDDTLRKIEGCTAMIDSGGWSGIELAAIHAHRCLAHTAAGQGDLALADCDQAVALAPEDPHSYAGRADLYVRIGALDRAIEDYSAAIRLDPIFVGARLDRARVYLAVGQPELALADYDQLLARGGIGEDDASRVRQLRADALNRLAWALYTAGDAATGLPHIEEALTARPDDANFLDTHATILCALDRADEARTGFAAVIAADESWARSYQQVLTDIGHDPGGVDGLWGRNSQAALDRWIEAGCPPQVAAAEEAAAAPAEEVGAEAATAEGPQAAAAVDAAATEPEPAAE